jgi:type I restriction enzyme, S subunit
MSVPIYPSYRETGIDWIGAIPTTWHLKALRYLVQQDNAGEVIDRTYWGGDAELLYTCALKPLACDFSGFPDWKRTGPRDLLLTRNGTPYVHKPVVNSIYTNVVQRITLNASLNREFLLVALQNAADNLRGYGVSIESLNFEMWKALRFPLPSFSEQAAIATFLDRETGKIDALVAEQERLMALLKEKRQAVISQAVTKGLDPNVPMKPSGVEWLGMVPEHWKVARVKHVARLESGHTPSKQFPEYWEGGDIKWVSLNDSKYLATNDYISETALKITAAGIANSSARLLPAGAVVFTRDATIGLTAITTQPMAVSQHLIAWCPSKAISSLYLLRVFNIMKPFLDVFTFGATIKTIGMPDVGKLVTPVPPMAEQILILDFLGQELKVFDTLIAEADRAITLLRERRAALISAAVTGKIDVRNLAAPQSEAA